MPRNTGFQSQWLGGSLQIMPPGIEVLGNAYFVDSVNGSDSDNSGSTWDNALATVDAAIAKCSADQGDVIFMAPWHVESEAVVDASIWTMSKAGVSLIGKRQGNQIPTFTFTDDGATATITGGNCLVKNCKFLGNVIDLAAAVTVGAAADGLVMDGCEIMDSGAALEIVYGISLTALASDVTIQNCLFKATAANTGGESAILAVGAADGLHLINNVFSGDWNDAVVDLTTAASLHILIADNVVYNLDAGDGLAVNCNASTTGSIVKNMIFAGKNTQAAIVAAGCHVNQNYQTTVEAESGNIVPPAGDWAA